MAADYQQPDYVEKRVRYFDGQFLKDQDFVDEQKYHIDRQRRPLRYLTVSGIVEGLTVKPGNQQSNDVADLATVAPGTAIDAQGQQIVLGSFQEIPLRQFRNQTIEVLIRYQEVPSDLAQEGGESHRRWHENPAMLVVSSGSARPDQAIRLARLTINGDGNVTLDADPTIRQYAGINLPSADASQPTLRSGGNAASRLALLSGSLSVTDRVGIGTNNPADRLSIQGGALAFQDADTDTSAVGLDYDKTIDALRIRGNVGGRTLNTDYLTIQRTSGNIGIGVTEPNRKLEVINDVSGISLEAGTGSPDSGAIRFGDNTGWKLHIGRSRESSSATTLNTGAVGALLTIQDDGNIGIGTVAPAKKLTVVAASEHLQLLRSRTETIGGKQVFLELFQDDATGRSVPEVFPSLRFHHNGLFSHRIEARSNGLHFKIGDLNSDTYVRIFAENMIVTGMIVMWSGRADQVPSGWALCDGQNNTPNLVDRFILGTASSFPSVQDATRLGGTATPRHRTARANATAVAVGTRGITPGGIGVGLDSHEHLIILDDDHRPPFYKLAFIIKL